MIKRLFLTALLVFVISSVSFANDVQKEITLDNSVDTTTTVEIGSINIFVSLIDVDGNNNAEIAIEIENTDETNTLLLFEQAQNEKELKKWNPSITYAKNFGGSKGERENVEACEDLKNLIKISPSKRETLFEKTSDKDTIVCKLPIYIAKNKNKWCRKILLIGKEEIELEIHVQDKEYISIKNSCDSLVNEIDTVTFCTNKYHQGEPIDSLKRKYKDKIDDLKSLIGSVEEDRINNGKDIEKFKNVSAKLDSIYSSIDEKTVSSCPKDHKPKPAHNCRYCSLSYKEIYHSLETIYINIDINDTKKTQVMSKVESLHNCVLSKNKKRHADKDHQKGIEEYYEKIKNLK